MNPITGRNPILARYFAGQESLESAASEFVRLIREQELGRPRTLSDIVRDHTDTDVPEGAESYELTEEDVPKMRALMERVEAQLDLVNEGAQRYLRGAGTSQFDAIVRLLARDVTATLGDRYVPVVWYFADNVRQLKGHDPSDKCIEDVQQYFQDTFVDTTWPSCPQHPNHPLNYADGAWRCPRDGAAVARLGELTSRAGNST